jgi:hypothetical protein
MEVGIVRTIEVDGKLYVDAEDYQSLLKRYEDAVGTKTNAEIIAALGVDEIPDDKPAHGCEGCKCLKTMEFNRCAICARSYKDMYKKK